MRKTYPKNILVYMLKEYFHHTPCFFLSPLILLIWFGNVCNLQIAPKYNNMFRVINKDTKTIYDTSAKFIQKTPKQRQ